MDELSAYPVSTVCRELGISSSTYYYHKKTAPRRKKADKDTEAVIKMFKLHMRNFGRRVIRKELKKEGISVSEYRISKILKANNLHSKYGRKKTKNAYTKEEVAEELISENIYGHMSKEERKGYEIWSMDFTECKVLNGSKYIMCGIKSVNGKGVSILRNCRNNAEAAIEALEEAIKKFGVPHMVTTDRGSPFISRSFNEKLNEYGIIHSMSRPHTPADNSNIESFWKSMKTEIGYTRNYTKEEFGIVVQYYEHYYNYSRPHSSLGYYAPLARQTQNVI